MNFRFVSITMVFVNKALLSGQSSLNAPLFITWYQCAVTAAACYAVASIPMVAPNNLSVGQLQISTSILKKVTNNLIKELDILLENYT